MFQNSRTLSIFIIGVIAVESWLLMRDFWMKRQLCQDMSGSSKQTCFVEKVHLSLRRNGVSAAYAQLADLYSSDPSFSEVCHSLTHEIGAFAYHQFRQGKKLPVTKDFAICSYGFYHGFMEALVAKGGDMDAARVFCARVDQELGKVTPDARLQCYHGIGHGTVNNHDPATWGKEQLLIDPALKLCEQVAKTRQDQSRCATGVFNGIATFYNEGLYKLKVRRDDPLWICRKQKKEYQDACYLSLNIALLQLTNGDLVAAAKFLEPIAEDTMAAHAMINLAAPVGSKNIASDNHESIIAACRSLQNRLRLACFQGYAFGMLEHGVPGKEYEKPLKFCGYDTLVPSEREGCFEYIISYLPQWYPKEKVREICRLLHNPLKTDGNYSNMYCR